MPPVLQMTPLLRETPFVFEEPKQSYFLLDCYQRDELLALGPLAPQRLKHIEWIHVVIQSAFKTQMMVARRLDIPHYQVCLSQIHALEFPHTLTYQEDYAANDFLYVSTEHSTEVERLLSTINFEQIGTRLLSRKPSHSVRQSFFQDFGICSGQCTSRKGDSLGIAKPSTKPGTTDPHQQELMITCSNVLTAMGITIFAFKKERFQSFAGKLAKGNQIEAMRLAITDEFNLCGIHEDQKTIPPSPLFPSSLDIYH